jgi:hypothetical protein
MINWQTGQNFYFHNGWWHGNTSSYITLRKEGVTIIALSNKFTRKTYDVRTSSVVLRLSLQIERRIKIKE